MTANEFISDLQKSLNGIPSADVEERLSFYSEMIADRMEDGISEEEAVAQIGPVESVAEQIISEYPLTKLVRERVKPKRKLRAFEIVLIILGSPVWLPLLISAAAILFSLYVCLLSAMFVIWSIFGSFVVTAIAGIVGGLVCSVSGNFWSGAALFGAGIALAGISILFFYVCRICDKGISLLTRKFVLWIKNLFMKKEDEK